MRLKVLTGSLLPDSTGHVDLFGALDAHERESTDDAKHLRHAFESDQKKRCALSILQRFCDVEWDGDRRKTIRVRLRTRCWMRLRRFVRARAIALYWFGLTAHLYAPGGVGCKRDRDEFEAEMGGKLVLE